MKCCAVMTGIMLILGSFSALGFGILDFIKIFGLSILDFFDFLTNSVMMPLAALATCILVVRVVGLDKIETEVCQSSKFKRKGVYRFVMKYLAPVFILVILISSIANVLGLINM